MKRALRKKMLKDRGFGLFLTYYQENGIEETWKVFKGAFYDGYWLGVIFGVLVCLFTLWITGLL
jgi:hypothetical protein